MKAKTRSDNWQAAFGNLMFLLFAVFLSVYALSRFEVKQLKEDVEKLKAELSNPAQKSKVNPDEPQSGSSESTLTSENTVMRDQILTSALKSFSSSKALDSTGPIESWLEVEEAPGGKLLVRISPRIIYKPGEAVPSSQMLPLLDDLASIIRSTGRSLKIEGHADGEDEEWLLRLLRKNPKLSQSLWSLSSDRASWIANYWVKKFDFNPEKIEVSGFGASRPLQKSGDPSLASRSPKRIELLLEKRR